MDDYERVRYRVVFDRQGKQDYSAELRQALHDAMKRIEKVQLMDLMGITQPKTEEMCHENTHVFGVGAAVCVCGKV